MEKDKDSLRVLNTKNLPLVDAAQLLQRFVTQVDEEQLPLGGDDVIKDPVAQNLLVAYNSGRKYLADKLARQTGKKKTKPSDDEADDKDQ